MNDTEQYIGVTYSNSCQPYIMTNTPETFFDPDMPKIIPDTGVNRPNRDTDMTYLKNKNIYEAIYQKLRKEYLHETNMHNIYNIIVVQTNEQL